MWTLVALNARIAAWRRRSSDRCSHALDPAYVAILSARWPNDEARVSELSKRHAALTAYLSGCDKGESFACMQVQGNRVVFVPSLIDPRRATEIQAYQFRLFRTLCEEHESIEVRIDCAAIDFRILCALLRESTADDMWAGLECWATMPCRVSRVEVISPRGLIGWSIMRQIGLSCLSHKIRERLVFVE